MTDEKLQDNPTVIKLRSPLKHIQPPVTDLSMRPATIGEIMSAKRRGGKDEGLQDMLLFSSVCEIDKAVMEKLEPVDWYRLQEVFQGFNEGKHLPPLESSGE